MQGLFPELMRKPDPTGTTKRTGMPRILSSRFPRPSIIGGAVVIGSAMAFLFGLEHIGVNISAITSGLFGGDDLATSGVMMSGVGSFFEKLSKKPSSDGFDGADPNSTMVLSTVQKSSAWLVVRSGMEPGKVLDIEGEKAIVGSGPDSEILLSDESVGDAHALIRENDSKYTISDLGSRTGTWLNDKLQSGVVLKDDSRITIGTTKLSLSLTYDKVKNGKKKEMQIIGGTLFVKAGANVGESFRLEAGDNVIGSDPGESGIELDDRTVSKRHVMLRVMSRVCRLYDLGSTNGTDVDGYKLEGVPLQDGDVIKFGKIEVRSVRESMM
jgi:pSer/pThr/pTyr-binding forkhead associated (FHA) protein